MTTGRFGCGPAIGGMSLVKRNSVSLHIGLSGCLGHRRPEAICRTNSLSGNRYYVFRHPSCGAIWQSVRRWEKFERSIRCGLTNALPNHSKKERPRRFRDRAIVLLAEGEDASTSPVPKRRSILIIAYEPRRSSPHCSYQIAILRGLQAKRPDGARRADRSVDREGDCKGSREPPDRSRSEYRPGVALPTETCVTPDLQTLSLTPAVARG